MKYRFVKTHQGMYPIAMMCCTLNVSRSGYYKWCKREPSQREKENHELVEQIRTIHSESRETYGSLKIQKVLESQGRKVGRPRILRLMKRAKLSAKRVRRTRRTTRRSGQNRGAPNLLNQQFKVHAPNRVWLSDITYVQVKGQWLYLAAVMDLFSRGIIGWSMNQRMTEQLTLNALQMALQRRRPEGKLLMHHSDQGSQYTSDGYLGLLATQKIQVSMSGAGNCYDNAPMESFFSNFKLELIHHETFETPSMARRAIFDYIEIFYNRTRIHSAIGYLAPSQYERQFMARQPCREDAQGMTCGHPAVHF